MKKLIIAAITIFLTALHGAYAAENIILETSLNTQPDSVYVNFKSDYKENVRTVKENNESVYFEIKNAKLSDNYKENSDSDLSIMSQQIGSKVRIYVKGDNIGNIKSNLIAVKGQKPFDWMQLGIFSLIFAFISFIAIRFYSATIKLLSYETSVNSPINGNKLLNEKLFQIDRRPEITYSKMNSEKSEVVDFRYAKGKKKIKIAI